MEEINKLKEYGFEGFLPIKELRSSTKLIPKVRGVYVVMRIKDTAPDFLSVGTGGFHKGRNPNVSIDELQNNWVEDSQIVYIGKGGDPGKKATLSSRIKQYLSFGAGGNVGHYGGRYIWQLSDAEDLVIAWKKLPEDIPSMVETNMIEDFKKAHNWKRPFANLNK